jgi:hypothetical protein
MNRRAITITEIIVILSCIAFMSVALATCGVLGKTLDDARTRKDQAQLRGIVASYAIFAESNQHERFPIPGMINRLPVDMVAGVFGNGDYQGKQQIQGRGPQDTSLNLSGWLHSAMIGDNYYDPTILISANENNPMVIAKGDQGSNASEVAYDYSMCDPASDSYWDPLFSGDITGQGQAEGSISGGVSDVCHTSFANLALCGERLNRRWDVAGDANNVILSSRGPEDGVTQGINYTMSPTLEMFGPSNSWQGIYVTSDGAASSAQSVWFDGLTYTPKNDLALIMDNAFAAEFEDFDHEPGTLIENAGGASGDIFMVLNVGSSKTDVNAEWDALVQ